MKRKIHLTEAQFREYMRTKLHESRQTNGKKIRLTEEQMRMLIRNKLNESDDGWGGLDGWADEVEGNYEAQKYGNGNAQYYAANKKNWKEYIQQNNRKIQKQNKGKFVLIRKPEQTSLIDKLYLVDRNKTRKCWWTYDLSKAMIFTSKDVALKTAKRLKYGTITLAQL